MKFVIKLFPEITIKSRPVRKQFINQLRRNIKNSLKYNGIAATVQGQWDLIEAVIEDDSQEMEARSCLQRVTGIAKILTVKEHNFKTFDDILDIAKDIYADKTDQEIKDAFNAAKENPLLAGAVINILGEYDGNNSGKATKITFSEEGVVLVKCLPHFALGMIAVVQVGDNIDGAKAKADWDKAKVAVAMNKEAIDKAEDRALFKAAMTKIGLSTPRSFVAHTMEEAFEALEEIGFPTIIRPSFTMGGSGGGIQTASLRDLGPQYTLVLLNGRRMAPADSGGTIDLNSIPLSAIERVEVLTDGASALYGSDAIAGVVNFILKDSVEGTQVSARYSNPQESGGKDWTFDISTGFGDFDNDGYNVVLSYL